MSDLAFKSCEFIADLGGTKLQPRLARQTLFVKLRHLKIYLATKMYDLKTYPPFDFSTEITNKLADHLFVACFVVYATL